MINGRRLRKGLIWQLAIAELLDMIKKTGFKVSRLQEFKEKIVYCLLDLAVN